MRFLDQFSVLLLDMNGTFMFGHDRLGPDDDYLGTYLSIGGRKLARDTLTQTINTAVDSLWRAYDDPARFDDFPTVAEVLSQCSRGIDDDELSIVEEVIALHEFGSIPRAHDEFLRCIAKTHGLAIVSNLWSRPDRWSCGGGPPLTFEETFGHARLSILRHRKIRLSEKEPLLGEMPCES